MTKQGKQIPKHRAWLPGLALAAAGAAVLWGAASELSGNWGALTWKPSACRRSMTPLQLDPSAHAP